MRSTPVYIVSSISKYGRLNGEHIMTILEGRRELLAAMKQFTLVRGETRRLPNSFKVIHIISGCAGVSYKGGDSILIPGDTLSFTSSSDFPVVTAMGRVP